MLKKGDGIFIGFGTEKIQAEVKTCQKLLWRENLLQKQDIDGIFGKQTETAIKVFQRLQKMPVTGIFDETVADRLKANMRTILYLHRFLHATTGTLGRLFSSDDELVAWIIEPPGPDSATEGSGKRIRAGIFRLKKYHSEKYQDHFCLENVPGRSNILIHSGNIAADTHGCLLPGDEYLLDDQLKITDSRLTLKKINDYLKKFKSAEIIITN